MDVDDIHQIDPNVDFNVIQPIHQKRTIAFVNHFLLSTVSFLNNFADSCESRLMQFELKLQKIEASLLILESQLSSIPDHKNEGRNYPIEINVVLPEVPSTADVQSGDVNYNHNNTTNDANKDHKGAAEEQEQHGKRDSLKTSEDPRYKKFSKMLQVGVPAAAVKMGMGIEGLDANILEL